MLTCEPVKQNRNRSSVRGVVGRRVTVTREINIEPGNVLHVPGETIYISENAPTVCTVKRVDARTGRYWLDRSVKVADSSITHGPTGPCLARC